MDRYRKYKIAIGILAGLVLIQAVFIAVLLRKPKAKAKTVVSKPKTSRTQIKPSLAKYKIALVLDDWGYSLNNAAVLSQLRFPLTLAVLPNLKYSERIAQLGHKYGFEIIMHLPLAPHEDTPLEKNTIITTMPTQKIREILSEDLSGLPYLKGVSNHMGSKATENPDVMGAIFQEIKARRLYYLDSFSSPKSICADLALGMNLKFARRDIFLDNKNDPDYIKMQLEELKNKARDSGYAIGIGHDRKVTLEVLREELPKIVKSGYKLVFVSELVR